MEVKHDPNHVHTSTPVLGDFSLWACGRNDQSSTFQYMGVGMAKG